MAVQVCSADKALPALLPPDATSALAALYHDCMSARHLHACGHQAHCYTGAHFLTARLRLQDRATVEQALDPRTKLVLFKMLNRGLFSAIHGCISTGKEANVYYAVHAGDGSEYAVKVYKTSILVFKDRDRCENTASPDCL
jgi:serine/threonine-protein kinase RIO1